MPVVLTETAVREIATIVKQKDLDPEAIRLRVGVKGGGCSGFSYLLDLTEKQRDDDEEWTYTFEVPSNGDGVTSPFSVRVICDPYSYLYLNGTTVDFKDEMMQRGFLFENPNASSTCGCGSSFSA